MPSPRSIPRRRLQSPWGPWPPPPTLSPMTVSFSEIRPLGTRFSPTPGAGETFASRLYFAPGGMSMRPQTGRWPDLGHGSDARAVRGRPPSSRKMAKMGWLRPVALWAQAGTVMESAKGLGPLLLGLFLLLLFLGERKVASLCARRVRTLIDTEVRGKAHR